MANCNNCSSCGGCAKELLLTEPELHILQKLGQIPFLPVARQSSDETPVYLEDEYLSAETYSLALACLEKKQLIELDYHRPLAHFDYRAYGKYSLHGSMALTARGQAVLELLERQGIQKENE